MNAADKKMDDNVDGCEVQRSSRKEKHSRRCKGIEKECFVPCESLYGDLQRHLAQRNSRTQSFRPV
jgi:hypothetical protein